MILIDGVKYRLWKPEKEEMLEEIVREHSREIWGDNSVYFTKKRLQTEAGITSIPDGYVAVFETPPCWYIVEIELSSHRLYDHIIPQISKFAVGITKAESQKVIVELIDEEIASDDVLKAWVKSNVAPLEVYKFLTGVIAKPPRLAIVIDEKTKELDEVLAQLPKNFEAVEAMEFKTFQREGCDLAVHAHLFEPLHKPPTVKTGKIIIEPPKEPELEESIAKANPEIRQLFFSLRERILKLGEGIREVPGKSWVDYRKSSTFVSPNIQKRKLVVYIKMGERRVNDRKGITSHVTWYGKLNTRFSLSSTGELDYAMELIKQAYDYVP